MDSAHEALHVAQLALGEAKKSGDQAQAQLAVDSATATRDAAATAVGTLVAVNGPTVAQGEIVFMPTMPARVQSAIATLGPLAQASSTGTPNGGSVGAGGLVSLAGGQLIVTTSIRSDGTSAYEGRGSRLLRVLVGRLEPRPDDPRYRG